MALVLAPHHHGHRRCIHPLFVFSIIVALLVLVPKASHCFRPKSFNASYNMESFDPNWALAGATWYGSRDGAGTDGGACGYQSAVERPPFNKMVSAGGPSIYESGQGCGACFEVKCTDNQACSGKPVTVTITDECPGCTEESVHFDLSGAAFGAMAKSGQTDQLRNAGKLQVQYRRVECHYPGVKVTVRIDLGSNSYYLAILVEYSDGDGDGSLKSVELQQAHQNTWTPMQLTWGATWKLNDGGGLKAPFSIKLTQADAGKTIVMDNVIPINWQPGQTYRSHVNFDG